MYTDAAREMNQAGVAQQPHIVAILLLIVVAGA
jgi:hypothetical protein